MNLDDTAVFPTIDSQNMLAQIASLPEQLIAAWKIGQDQDLPIWSDIRQVCIAGMGGSAIGGDLLAAFAAPICKIPIFIHRDYGLPAWAEGPQTLVIAVSHSGNTEETLSTFETARDRACRLVAISTDGKLAAAASATGTPLLSFRHDGQPRAAVGYSFGLLLSTLTKLNILDDPNKELEAAVQAMAAQQNTLNPDVPVPLNPAKRLAGQFIDRWVTVIGAGSLAPVARRWKTQINEIAKAWSQFEFLPEANHNLVAGTLYPEKLFTNSMVLFLRGDFDHPRNLRRLDLTFQALVTKGINSTIIKAQGQTPLAQMWTCLLLGDYVSYYLAMAYKVDPTPVTAIEEFKRALADVE